MFGLQTKALSIGLAALAFGGTLSLSAAPAQAQFYYGPGYGAHYGYRPVHRSYNRPAFHGYRPARSAYYGYGGYRPARSAYYGYGAYRPVRYGYGYGAGYGYGYPYYRRSSNAGAVAAGLIGGLALGAIAANAARPVYYGRPVYSDCWLERRRTVNRVGNVVIRRVRVCG